MRNKVRRKEERQQKRQAYLHEMYQGYRIHIATWCVFSIWLMLLVLLVLLFVYVKTGNYSIW